MSFHLSIFFCIHRGYVVFFYTDLKYNLRVGLSAVSVNKVHYQIEILCIAALTLNIEKKVHCENYISCKRIYKGTFLSLSMWTNIWFTFTKETVSSQGNS